MKRRRDFRWGWQRLGTRISLLMTITLTDCSDQTTIITTLLAITAYYFDFSALFTRSTRQCRSWLGRGFASGVLKSKTSGFIDTDSEWPQMPVVSSDDITYRSLPELCFCASEIQKSELANLHWFRMTSDASGLFWRHYSVSYIESANPHELFVEKKHVFRISQIFQSNLAFLRLQSKWASTCRHFHQR